MTRPSVTHGFKRLAPLLKTQRTRLLLAALALLAASAASLVYPWAIGLAVDAAALPQASSPLRRALLVFLAAFALQAVAVGVKTWLFASASERIVVELKQKLLAKLLSQPLAFFDRRKLGELLNRLGQDCGQIKSAATGLWANALQLAISVVGSLVLLLTLSPRLAALALPALPLLWFLASRHGRNLRDVSREVQDSLASAGVVAEEALSNVRTVRAFDRESYELQRYAQRLETFASLNERRARLSGWFTTLTVAVGYGALVVMLWQGATLVQRGALSLGELTSFLVYAAVIATALPPLSSVYTSFASALGASERVFELLELPGGPTAPPFHHTSSRAPRPARVAFVDVAFRYAMRPDVTVLREFRLILEAGETVALVGRFGAGKSTVASLLCGFYEPDAGAVTIDGVDVRALGRPAVAARVALVSQEPVLFSASIEENVRYGRLDASDDDVRSALERAGAAGFVARLPEGLQTQVGQRGLCLSGGQRQAIAIARALLKEPDVLVLDEATSALDAGSERSLRAGLERLMHGRTALIIAHRLSTILMARRICVLDGGQIVAQGSHEELLQREPLYRELIAEQLSDRGMPTSLALPAAGRPLTSSTSEARPSA